MTFGELRDKISEKYGTLHFRDILMLRDAFDMVRSSEAESELRPYCRFEDESQRDDWDLVCSCGAVYRCDDESEMAAFLEQNFYCGVCGKKFKFVK